MGYEYINLDDCWQASERDMEGRIMPDAERFPSGMKVNMIGVRHMCAILLSYHNCNGLWLTGIG